MAEKIHVRTVRSRPDLAADLRIARVLAKLMDSQFEVAGVRFGLDALVGLVPVAGDLVSAAASLFPVYVARKHGLGGKVIVRMLGNIAIDFSSGLVPVVGDAADVIFKANLKNLRILENAARKQGIRVD